MTTRPRPARPGPARPRRASRGRPEAEDVPEQHPPPSLAVEGQAAAGPEANRERPHHLGGVASRPRRRGLAGHPVVPRVQRPPGRRRLTGAGDSPDMPAGSSAPPSTAELQARLGLAVEPQLLERALTHRSYAYENGGVPAQQRGGVLRGPPV